MRMQLLTWIALGAPARVWMALPNDWRRWWMYEWGNR